MNEVTNALMGLCTDNVEMFYIDVDDNFIRIIKSGDALTKYMQLLHTSDGKAIMIVTYDENGMAIAFNCIYAKHKIAEMLEVTKTLSQGYFGNKEIPVYVRYQNVEEVM